MEFISLTYNLYIYNVVFHLFRLSLLYSQMSGRREYQERFRRGRHRRGTEGSRLGRERRIAAERSGKTDGKRVDFETCEEPVAHSLWMRQRVKQTIRGWNENTCYRDSTIGFSLFLSPFLNIKSQSSLRSGDNLLVTCLPSTCSLLQKPIEVFQFLYFRDSNNLR